MHDEPKGPGSQRGGAEESPGRKIWRGDSGANGTTRREFFKRVGLGGGAALAGAGAVTLGLRATLNGFPNENPIDIDPELFGPMDQRNQLHTFATSMALDAKHPERNEQYSRLRGYEFSFQKGMQTYEQLPWDNSKPGYTQLDKALQLAGWGPLKQSGSYGMAFGVPNTPLLSWDQSEVESEQYKFASKRDASDAIRSAARVYGAVRVGFARRDKRWDYNPMYDSTNEKVLTWEDDFPFEPKTVIVLAVPQDFDCIQTAPARTAGGTVGDAYTKMATLAGSMAKFMRLLGYHAVGAGNDLGISVAYGILAGLGEAGRNQQLLVPGFGPRVRLCKVYTDFEDLEYDEPRSWGIADFCKTCKKCAEACPSGALSLDDDTSYAPTHEFSKEPGYDWPAHVGVKKFYTDAKKCLNYWIESDTDCGACIASCTFNEPDYWHHWLVMAINPYMPRFLHAFFADLHPAFGYGRTQDPSKVAKFWKTGRGMRVNPSNKHIYGTSNIS